MPWLELVGDELARGSHVVACSALRRSYRDRLLRAAPATVFLHLELPTSELGRRLHARADHFMPTSLLESQLATLEPLARDEPGITLDGTEWPDAIVAAFVASDVAARYSPA